MVKSYDFCIAWNWEHDADFIRFLEEACHSQGLSLLQITPGNLTETLRCLHGNQLTFRTFFDRASDTDANFLPVDQWALYHGVYCINPRDREVRSRNKAVMHYLFIEKGLHTPYTIILPSYEEQPYLPPIDLRCLGDSFIIKPAHGSGGAGVVKKAVSMDQILIARQKFPSDKYLLQTFIVPIELGSHPAWFRVIYCTGQIYPCWWPATSIYTPITQEEEKQYSLSPLRHIAEKIEHICGLELFSTEIALTTDGIFVVVDYINDQIDLRLKSKAVDGVPDNIVCDIAGLLVTYIQKMADHTDHQRFLPLF